MLLTKSEQEVVIVFSASDTRAQIYTTNPVYIRRLSKLSKTYSDVYVLTDTMYTAYNHTLIGVVYECPIPIIKFGKPISEKKSEAIALNSPFTLKNVSNTSV